MDKDEDEARRLYSDVRKRMGEAFWAGRSPDLEGVRMPDGTLAISGSFDASVIRLSDVSSILMR